MKLEMILKNGDHQEHIANLESNLDAPIWDDSKSGDLQENIDNLDIFVNLESESDAPIWDDSKNGDL